MSQLKDLKAAASEARAALDGPARAFRRAQKKGYVWIGEDGFFETHEGQLGFVPEPPAHPEQLRLI